MSSAALSDVLVTEDLHRRPSRPPDYRAEADAMAALTAALADPGSDALHALADAIVRMGIAESSGVSVRITGEDAAQCLLRAAAGRWRDHVGITLRLDQTPCGVTIERNAACLFDRPERYFPVPDVVPALHEMLMVPLRLDGEAIGAVWAAFHEPTRAFEREDVRLLLRLAAPAAVAFRMETALRQSEQERAEAAAGLQQTRESLRQMVEGAPLLLWRASDGGYWSWASPQWTRLAGQSVEASRGRGWLAAVHPDDRQRAVRAWRLAPRAEALDIDYRIRDEESGRYRWFQTRARPVRDPGGEIREWIGSSTDIDDLQMLREHEQALRLELQHRVRNTLAVIRSIARRTAEGSETLDDFQMHFDGRLGAFARSQSLVTRDPNAGVDLETLVAEELLAHHAHEGDRVTISGPAIRLKPSVADALALAIHELTVNAVKYGGLSSDRGNVTVTWTVNGPVSEPALTMLWRDMTPDRPAPQRARQGFGSELIERSLAYELDATADISFGPDGVRCAITIPLAGRLA